MSRPTIILDPGHGGSAPAGKSTPYGAPHASGQHEKVINLELARRVRGALSGHDVRLTRSDDRNLSLGARAGMARSYGGDTRFVSLHSNWGHPSSLGSQTWVHTRALGSSHELASAIQQEIARLPAGARGPLGVQAGDLAVLDPMALGHGAAACLVEARLPTDHIGNPMVPPPNQLDAIARAIANGIQSVGYGGAPPQYSTHTYGAVDVVIGASGWHETLRGALSSGQAFSIIISGERLVTLLNNVVAEASRRGINLLDAGISDLRKVLALAQQAGSQMYSQIRQWLISLLPRPLSSLLSTSDPHPEALALGGVAIVAIVLIVAAVLYMISDRAFDWQTDRDTQETSRQCLDRGYRVSLNRGRTQTDGISAGGTSGFNTNVNDQVVLDCTPP